MACCASRWAYPAGTLSPSHRKLSQCRACAALRRIFDSVVYLDERINVGIDFRRTAKGHRRACKRKRTAWLGAAARRWCPGPCMGAERVIIVKIHLFMKGSIAVKDEGRRDPHPVFSIADG